MLIFNVSYQRGVLKLFFLPVSATEKIFHALERERGGARGRSLLHKLFFLGFLILSLETGDPNQGLQQQPLTVF